MKFNIGIIGAGNMGEAVIKGLSGDKRYCIYAAEKDNSRSLRIVRRYKVKKAAKDQLTKTCKAIIICVKPQDMEEVLLDLKAGLTGKHLVISIAAGITTRFIENNFKEKVPVIRVMPNMPGLIGEGICAFCRGRYPGEKDAALTRAIFSKLGEVFEIGENKMNAVTAVSGSGPGLFAFIADGFIKAAQKAGFEKETACFLAMKMLKGTLLLLEKTKMQPAELVKKVASKAGTTEAGLKVFKDKNLESILEQAVFSAARRAKELNK